MKKFIWLMAFSLIVSVAMADVWDDSIAKAQALKKKGDFVGAAEATPRTLCAAIYYWNAAASVVGHLNDNNDWAINATLTAAQKTEGLRLLALAQTNLTAALAQAGAATDDGKYTGAPDDGTCHLVDAAHTQDLIDEVTACINGNCK